MFDRVAPPTSVRAIARDESFEKVVMVVLLALV
jgi:hypothetical protein